MSGCTMGRFLAAIGLVFCMAAAAQGNEPLKLASSGAPSKAGSNDAMLQDLARNLLIKMEEGHQQSATVLDFTDLQGSGTELGRFLAQELSDQIVSLNGATAMVDRSNVQYLLRENKLSMGGLIDPATSKKLGSLIGVDTLIVGTTTPIGEAIHLSVRAVSVQTGKIVAAQSITLSGANGLAELSSRGVANSANAADNGDGNTLRDRMRADTLKFDVKSFTVGKDYAGRDALLSFVIENHSGIGIGIGIKAGSTSVGPCGGESAASGLPLVDERRVSGLSQQPEPANSLEWLPSGGRVSATIDINYAACAYSMFAGQDTVSATINVVLAAGKEVVTVPLTADKVAVHYLGGL